MTEYASVEVAAKAAGVSDVLIRNMLKDGRLQGATDHGKTVVRPWDVYNNARTKCRRVPPGLKEPLDYARPAAAAVQAPSSYAVLAAKLSNIRTELKDNLEHDGEGMFRFQSFDVFATLKQALPFPERQDIAADLAEHYFDPAQNILVIVHLMMPGQAVDLCVVANAIIQPRQTDVEISVDAFEHLPEESQ